MTDEQIAALRKASAVLCGTGYHAEASTINSLLSASIADTAGAADAAFAALLKRAWAKPVPYETYDAIKTLIKEMAGRDFPATPAPSVADAAGASDIRRAALEEAYQTALSCDGALNNAGAVAMKIRALIKRDEATTASTDAMDAKRYRFLRENMRFSSPRGEITTMTMRAPIPAPTHDIHNDWMGERFDASVDRAIDAALAKESEND